MRNFREGLLSVLTKIRATKSGKLLFLIILIMGAHSNLLFPEFTENPDGNIIYPNLRATSSLPEYLKSLLDFGTIDFQPVRDLTLFMDLWFFDHTGIVLGVFLNCVIWIIICYNLLIILEETVTSIAPEWCLLLIATLSVNPIYSQSINWVVARKHLLAVMFTVLATRTFFRYLKGNATELRIIILYTLSLLSLPASMLWPLWAAIHLKLTGKLDRQVFKKLLIPLIIIMILIIGINWAYYKTSYTFLEIYPRKADDKDPFMMAMIIGQLFAQFLYPFDLAMFNFLGTKALVGFVLFVIFIIWVLYKHGKNPDVLSWVCFSGGHLIIFLSTPNIYYDTYVLFPSIGLFFLFVVLTKEKISRFAPLLPVLLCVWATSTFINNPLWGSTVEFYKNSFDHQKTCSNAIGYATGIYLEDKVLPNDLFDYIQTNECMIPQETESPGVKIRKITFESLQLYAEDEIDYDYRRQRLYELGLKHFYPMSIYMAFLAKYNQSEEVEKTARILNGSFEGTDVKVQFDPVFMKKIPVYCQKHQLPECLRYVERWEKK